MLRVRGRCLSRQVYVEAAPPGENPEDQLAEATYDALARRATATADDEGSGSGATTAAAGAGAGAAASLAGLQVGNRVRSGG